MTVKRFKIYNKETLDTYIEDTQDCYSNGDTKTYWFGDNEDFCDLFKKLNELSDENEQLKNNMKIKLCNNCVYWRLGTASLDDNYCSLTGEWADWEGNCEKWKGYHD